MCELDHKEGWVLNNWCFQTVVLEKTLESPLDSKEIKPVNPKGNQPCIFIGRTDAESEAPIFWPPDGKSWLTEKDPDAGKDWGQKGVPETDGWITSMTQWTWVWANSEQTLRDSEGQGSLGCCSPLGYEKLDTTERLNNNKGTDGAAAHQHSMKMCFKSVPSSAGWAAGAVNTTVKTEVPAQSKISRRYFHFSYSDKLCYAITHFIIIF